MIKTFAAEVGSTGPVAVEGARTRWALGGSPSPEVKLVAAPSGVVEYRPEEMIVRVGAGTPVAELAAALSERGQRCSLPDRGGTVGGAVAVGENHIDRPGRGAVRDSVLELTYVGSAGEVVRGGGAVVKNVSGFDLPKLMVGALGTLGLIAEVVLRTNPAPEASRWLSAPSADPVAVAAAVLAPSAVLWNGERTWVHLEGHPADIAAETEALGRLAPFDPAEGAPALPQHRWSLTPAEAASLTEGSFVASIGVGTVWADTPQPDREVDPASAMVAQRMKQLFDPGGRLNPGRMVG